MKRSLPLLLLALLVVFPRRATAADEPWETEVRAALDAQDQELGQARRQGSLGGVATRYASRLGRQPTALNHFLLGRVLYFSGDKDGARRHLVQSLEMEPRFWFSRLRIAMLEVEEGHTQRAEDALAEVLRAKPHEPDALKLLARIRMAAEDWDGALRPLEMLLSLDSSDENVRRMIVVCHMKKEDWTTALSELRVLRDRHRDDPDIRWLYARALFETGDYKETVRELEALNLQLTQPDVRLLDMLRIAYARQKDWKGVERTIERMLPLVPEGDVKEKLQRALDELRAGHVPGEQPQAPTGEEAEAQNRLAKLIEQAMDDADAEARREALQTYYEAAVPMLPSALARRVFWKLEPDATCRKWLHRIMGRLQNGALAQIAAYGLYDPDPSVQVVAAEAIGEIGAPSGILYLLPFFLGPSLDGTPSEVLTRKINAARGALIQLTGRPDAMGGDGVWIPADRLAAMRLDWQQWLAGPAGVRARLAAIHDMGERGEDRPHVYLIEDVQDPHAEVARAAYGVILHRAQEDPGKDKDAVAAAMWPRFPRFEPSALEGAGLAKMQKAVEAWWDAWLAAREKQRSGR